METYAYRRRSGAMPFFAVLAVFLLTVCLFVGVFWWYGGQETRVSLGKEYYFLVRDCEDTTAAAVAGQVYLAGGAGYLLEGAGDAVVLACYFSRGDAERVQTTMLEKQVETRILTLGTAEFSLRGEGADLSREVASNIGTAETCARILYDTANGLERTDLTQEEARAAVRGVVKSLRGLRRTNGERGEDFFARWDAELSAAERRGTELAEGILFAKDLRYMQISLLMAIVRADAYFT